MRRPAEAVRPPTRKQWIGLAGVVHSNEEGQRPRAVAGGKRCAVELLRKNLIRWFHDPRPAATARLSGWDITDAGREAYWDAQQRYGEQDSDLVEEQGNTCRGCGDEIPDGRVVCAALECGGGKLLGL